jgi:hypothetical protein
MKMRAFSFENSCQMWIGNLLGPYPCTNRPGFGHSPCQPCLPTLDPKSKDKVVGFGSL